MPTSFRKKAPQSQPLPSALSTVWLRDALEEAIGLGHRKLVIYSRTNSQMLDAIHLIGSVPRVVDLNIRFVASKKPVTTGDIIDGRYAIRVNAFQVHFVSARVSSSKIVMRRNKQASRYLSRDLELAA